MKKELSFPVLLLLYAASDGSTPSQSLLHPIWCFLHIRQLIN
jgi:hypothetical protein